MDTAFDLFDRDKSGEIDFREFATAIAICCFGSVKEKIRLVFDLFDEDRDGALSTSEFDAVKRMTLSDPSRSEVGHVVRTGKVVGGDGAMNTRKQEEEGEESTAPATQDGR